MAKLRFVTALLVSIKSTLDTVAAAARFPLHRCCKVADWTTECFVVGVFWLYWRVRVYYDTASVGFCALRNAGHTSLVCYSDRASVDSRHVGSEHGKKYGCLWISCCSCWYAWVDLECARIDCCLFGSASSSPFWPSVIRKHCKASWAH